MNFLVGFLRVAEAINEWVGRVVMWLSLGIVLVCFIAVYLRYALGTGVPWLQELYVWQHAFVFLLGAGFTLLHGGHVRVDLFYGSMSTRNQARVDLLGTVIFLLPFMLLLYFEAIPFVELSWRNGESSIQPGGMPAIYILKVSLQAFCVLVSLQGLATIARSILILSGRTEFAPAATSH